jgi:hypothetical protein
MSGFMRLVSTFVMLCIAFLAGSVIASDIVYDGEFREVSDGVYYEVYSRAYFEASDEQSLPKRIRIPVVPMAIKILYGLLGTMCIASYVLFRSGYRVGAVSMIWMHVLLLILNEYLPSILNELIMLAPILLGVSVFIVFCAQFTQRDVVFTPFTKIGLKYTTFSKYIVISCAVMTLLTIAIFYNTSPFALNRPLTHGSCTPGFLATYSSRLPYPPCAMAWAIASPT